MSEADVISLYNYYYDNYTLGYELKILIDYLIVSEGEVLFFNYQLISIKKNNKFIESNLFWMSIEKFSHSKLNNNTVPLTLFVIFMGSAELTLNPLPLRVMASNFSLQYHH